MCLRLLALLLVAFVAAARGADGTALAPNTGPSKVSVVVSAKSNAPVAVPLTFQPGDTAVIAVKGFWQWRPTLASGVCGPQGYWGSMPDDLPLGALIIQCDDGEARARTVADRLNAIELPHGGTLALSINDTGVKDNEGELRVDVYRAAGAAEARDAIQQVVSGEDHDATVFVICDDLCTVYVNGARMLQTDKEGSGRVFAFNTRLRNGDVIAVDAQNVAREKGLCAWVESPGFLTTGTDESWAAADAVESGWQEQRYPERGWQPAAEVSQWHVAADAFLRGAGDARVVPVWGRTDRSFLRKTVAFRAISPPARRLAPREEAARPPNAVLTMACDNAAALYVNGELKLVNTNWSHPTVRKLCIEKGDLIAVHAYDANGGAESKCGLMLDCRFADGRALASGSGWTCTERYSPGWSFATSAGRGWHRVGLLRQVKHGMRDIFLKEVPGTRAEMVWGNGGDIYLRLRY